MRLRPFRHLIRVMSGQKDKKKKGKKTKRQKEKRKKDKKTKRQKTKTKKRVEYCDIRAVSHSFDVFGYSWRDPLCRFGMTIFVEVGPETKIYVVDPYCRLINL